MTGILAPKPQVVQAPTPTPPPTMPDTQSPDVLAARRQAANDAASRAGRSSTILSRAMQSNGAGDYSSKTTGAAS